MLFSNKEKISGGPICITAMFALLLSVAQVPAADFSIIPSLSISQEYTDNVFDNNLVKRSDYITRAQPGVSFKYNAPLWDWDLGYNFDYRHYAKGSRDDDITHNGNLKGVMRLVDEKLFLELSDSYKRMSLDVARDTTNESLYQNQSDQNVGTVSPYLLLHPTATTMVKTGYRYINTWYKEPQAVSKQDHVGFFETSYEVTPQIFATAGYTFTREFAESATNNLNRHEVYLGPRYEYADKSFIFAQGGAIIIKYNTEPYTTRPYWNAGITHSFETAVLNLSASVKYSDDPLGAATLETGYGANLTKNFNRGTLTLQGSYTEFSPATTDSLTQKRYSTGFTSTFELLQDLRGRLGLTFEYYNNILLDAITRRYSIDSGLSWLIVKDTTLELTYRYIDYSSDKIATDNNRVNRAIIEVRRTF